MDSDTRPFSQSGLTSKASLFRSIPTYPSSLSITLNLLQASPCLCIRYRHSHVHPSRTSFMWVFSTMEYLGHMYRCSRTMDAVVDNAPSQYLRIQYLHPSIQRSFFDYLDRLTGPAVPISCLNMPSKCWSCFYVTVRMDMFTCITCHFLTGTSIVSKAIYHPELGSRLAASDSHCRNTLVDWHAAPVRPYSK
ncbi:hypothetical protein ES702_02593 [subsurface metagenome]